MDSSILDHYTGDINEFTLERVRKIVKQYQAYYTNERSLLVSLSRLKNKILKKTKIQGYVNGIEYRDAMIRQNKEAVLLKNLQELKPDESKLKQAVDSMKQMRTNRAYKSFDIPLESVIDMILLLDSKDTVECFIALVLVSGRRMDEVFEKAMFKKDGQYSLQVDGILKTKNNKSTTIPCLVPAHCFIDAIDRFRASGISKNTLRINCNTLLKNIHPDLTIHKLRSLYVDAIYNGICSPEIANQKWSKVYIIEKFLVHDSTDLTMDYMNWRIKKT